MNQQQFDKLWKVIVSTESILRNDALIEDNIDNKPTLNILRKSKNYTEKKIYEKETITTNVVKKDNFTLKRDKSIIINSWDDVIDEIENCNKCNLNMMDSTKKPIVGIGKVNSSLLIITDIIDKKSFLEKIPLINNEKHYLEKWLSAINLSNDYYITNIIKCRTPGSRPPFPNEVNGCLMNLINMVKILQPRIILTLGGYVARVISGVKKDLSMIRKMDLTWENIPVVTTYHPRDVLDQQNLRAPVWSDLQRLKKMIE